jgi:predicted DNA-binding transcriptional regulator AlpA
MTETKTAPITADLLDESQAAQYCHLSKKTLQAWRSSKNPNQPPYMKLGRRVFYRPTDLDAWQLSNMHFVMPQTEEGGASHGA